VIAEVAQLHSINSSVNCDLCLCVAELTPPFHEDVICISRQVVADYVHDLMIVYKRNNVKQELNLVDKIVN